jgi:hypothetical protein
MMNDDDELRDLLAQLDDEENVVEQIEDEINNVIEDESIDLEESEQDEIIDDSIECTLKPLDTRRIEEITTAVVETQSTPAIDVVKYHERLDQVTTEVLTACRADRQEAQDVIELLRMQIDDAISKTHAPQRMWVDGLVKAVEVKAGINATAVKIIEANAKMLAATRAGVNILNQNIATGSQDLEDILNQPLTDLDEF